MKKNSNKIKNLVFGVFIAALFIPMAQHQFNFMKEIVLKGFFDVEKFPEFSNESFIKGEFQEKFEKATTENIGFHDTFVRTLNQLNYWIYNISKSNFVTVGKNNYLFGASYISGYNGDDFVGQENINLQIEKTKVVERELKKKHVDILFAFAPGKGSYYSEYIPDKYLYKNNIDSSNYACYIKACSRAKLNVVDLRKYFLSIKDTVKHPLFSQVGVHWSDYAAYLAIDTIAKKIAEIRNIKTRAFRVSAFKYLDTIKVQDRDVENLMNIYTTAPHYNMAYLKIKYRNDTAYKKPNVLTIADSYFSTIVATNIVDSIFSDWDYWLYNNYSASLSPGEVFNFKSEVEKRDVVMLLATDGTLSSFPYGFINIAYEAYAPKDKNYYALKNKELKLFVLDFFANVNKDKKWKSRLISSAKEKGISETQEFFNNALWLYQERQKALTHN